ncbi:MAG TPA: ferrous iron transport protein B [Kiritimatiellia bacterium]|nr:ferrous iron transport protein B [Kiritimatiellia bacterium]HMP33168.1 ferrous iron transport protein B [Kiritimatiellia bacterium]
MIAVPRPLVALIGSPNTGKTTLFNALTGLRARTANFSGTTVELKLGLVELGPRVVEVLDLPGVYSLTAATADEQVTADVLAGRARDVGRPDLAVVLADANNLERSLFVISQLIERELPVVVALNLIDLAERHGITVDPASLSREIGCPVIPTVASEGRGIDALKAAIADALARPPAERVALVPPPTGCSGCSGCPFQARYNWSDRVSAGCVKAPRVARERKTDKLDAVLTHPVVGVAAFLAVMLAVFYLIFSVASVPMDMIDALFASLGGWVAAHVPEGDFRSFLVDGVIAGVGGILIFLPQICILFFFLALLDDSGYLARAAFVMDRLMRRIGLPGTAFVPLLSAHACAIPAIMSTRVIRDPRDRLVTILVAPLMTCSARIPVYAMVVALLFPDDPAKAALLFTGAYGLGIAAALTMAWLFKKTILPGESKPLVLELPGYRIPGLRTALLFTYDRARVFVAQAGTIILVISIGLWVLATFPKTDAPPAAATALIAQAEALAAAGETEAAASRHAAADHLTARDALENSFAGRLGKIIEPVVRPLGFDWQIGVGIITSFAAREVIVSTLSVVYGLGADTAEENSESLYDAMRRATHPDGRPVFTLPACLSLLVFYVLAMQCLPTQAATRRETNSWKWPLFQLGYMTALAYTAALVTYQGLTALGY